MTNSPWIWIATVWLVTLVVGGVLWQRFTRVPAQVGGVGLRAATSTRRVVPLWLALVLLVLFGIAVWLTVRWGTPLWSSLIVHTMWAHPHIDASTYRLIHT